MNALAPTPLRGAMLSLPLAARFDLSSTPWRLVPLSYRDDVWCLVDAVDYGWIIEHTWNVWWSGRARWQLYAKRNIGPGRATVRMHREILKRFDLRPDCDLLDLQGDHLNGQTLDNRRGNLRWATGEENRANTHAREKIPSLELILMRLLGAATATAEVPF